MSMAKENPILPENTKIQMGRSAQRNNILAAKLVAETVRTTLGPKGMDKMLVDATGEVLVTNDGATILTEMAIEHPTARMIVEVARTQESEVGDGTTSAVILAGELLKQAENLLDKNIHPTIIINGYRIASHKALEVLETYAKQVSMKDEEVLKNIAKTAMTGKSAESARDVLADLCVQAVTNVTQKENNKLRINLSNIRLIPINGTNTEHSELINGMILDKERVHPGMPKKIEHAKVALLNLPLEIRDTETDAKITISSPDQMQQFLDQEERMLKQLVDKVIASGATVVITQKGVDDVAQHYLAKAGIMVARRVRKSDIEVLSQATGAKLITSLSDLDKSAIGKAGLVEQRTIGDQEMIVFTQAQNAVTTLLVKGATSHVSAEMIRSVEDALGVLATTIMEGQVVPGAGAPEMVLSKALRDHATTVAGKEQLAVQAFAQSLEIIPVTLAENAGLDPIDTLTDLSNAHAKGNTTMGVNVFNQGIIDAWKLGIVEPAKIKSLAITSATEVATMILRIDDIIAAGKMSEHETPNVDEY